MEEQPQKQWGTTKPISTTLPTTAELKLTDELVSCLKARDNFETPEGIQKRKEVLAHVTNVTKEFITRVGRRQKLSEEAISKLGGKVVTFGSFALGVYGPSSDIDTCIVAPRNVRREDFFDIWPQLFRDMSDKSQISELVEVPEAHVPIVKMAYRGISLDLIFGSLPSQPSIPEDLDLSNVSILRGLDDVGGRTVNGPRVVKELLALVPEHKSFRYALRTIKLWSNQRGIYGAVFGYPGGIAWAIMVARIAQLFPNACGATIVCKFFNLMKSWTFPRPVMLKDVSKTNPLGLPEWNPTQNRNDRAHLMPVITPAYPAMCSTHLITKTTKEVIMAEFERGVDIVTRIQDGSATWDALFERHTFFTKDHKFYLSVVATSLTKDADEKFKGWVQSKISKLAKGIEESDFDLKRKARPYMKAFDRAHRCANQEQIERVKQGVMDYWIRKADLPESGEPSTEDGSTIIYTSTFYIGLTVPEGSRSFDISHPATTFKEIVESNEVNKAFDREKMFCRIIHTKDVNLPDDVFVEGEAKPTKPPKDKERKKKKGRTNGDSKSRKRHIDETEPEVRNSRPVKALQQSYPRHEASACSHTDSVLI
ncbi:Poly(A) polymeras-like protein [Massarina eburnea CBS 473.64]|uniref:Poly(A) polymerase n=1 Tax=Massarina eburnea CBS 473.64 TaxID=1395130 RepID=A0A6A6S668_9PLEO|nr:Poly(A) polymeras-like protein [Massarina eburnea CBS 473.64]